MTDEWGPWVDHDGKGCPVPPGTMVQCVWLTASGLDDVADTGATIWPVPLGAGQNPADSSWWWRILRGEPVCYSPLCNPIIRYRVRKPRALIAMREMVENLPERVEA